MKKKILCSLWKVIGLGPLFFLASCEAWILTPEDFPEVRTLYFEVGENPEKGLLHGEIDGLLEGSFVEFHGHVWSSSPDSLSVDRNEGQSFLSKRGNGMFQSEVNELEFGQTYYFRAYIIYEGRLPIYGEVLSFTTASLTPVLNIDSIAVEEELFKATIFTSFSNLPIDLLLQSYGIIWSRDPTPDIETDSVFREQGIIISEPTVPLEKMVLLEAGDNYLSPFIEAKDSVYYGESELINIGDFWLPRAPLEGTERSWAVGISIGSKGYICMGQSSTGSIPGWMWEFDPLTDSWAPKTFYSGVGDHGLAGFSIEGKGYIGMGIGFSGTGGSSYEKDLWEYTPSSKSWNKKEDLVGTGRYFAVGLSIEGKGYIGTGANGSELLKDFWEYDPIGNSWMQKADFGGTPRVLAVAFSINGKGYVGTGQDSANQFEDFWAYEPTTNNWQEKAPFGGGKRSGAVGFSIGNKGYIGTGYDSSGFYKDFWEYDPSTNHWDRKSDYKGRGRSDGVGFSIGQRGYMGTGWDPEFSQDVKDFWEYVPD